MSELSEQICLMYERTNNQHSYCCYTYTHTSVKIKLFIPCLNFMETLHNNSFQACTLNKLVRLVIFISQANKKNVVVKSLTVQFDR